MARITGHASHVFVLGLEFALSKSDERAPSEITRIGLQDDVTFTGTAALLWCH